MNTGEEASYPSKCARGIRDEAWAGEDPPYESAFLFDQPDTGRADGFRELSVSWLDNRETLDILIGMSYHGRALFTAGIAVLNRSKIDLLRERFEQEGVHLDYERRPSRRNPYHGNLLIGECDRLQERLVASKLAVSADVYAIGEEMVLEIRSSVMNRRLCSTATVVFLESIEIMNGCVAMQDGTLPSLS